MWKQVLSVIVLVLGIYIVYLSFPPGTNTLLPSDTSYHIGCYDPQISHSHSSDLLQTLQNIEIERQQKLKLNMFNSIALNSNFEGQIQEIAGAFQGYLDEYYRLKFQTQQDLHYHNSLKLAKHKFEKCVQELNLNDKQCHKAWQDYLQATEQFYKVRDSLSDLILRKQKQEKLIAVNVLEHNDMDQEQIQKLYNDKIQQISVKIKIIEDEIVILQTERKEILKQIQVVDSELQSLKRLRSKCPENKNLIIFCRQVSKTVSQLGVKIEDTKYDRLQNRIKIKKNIMSALQAGIKKMKKFGNSPQLLTQKILLQQHQKELKLLNAEVENIETTEEVICRICSEQKIQELDNNITKLQKQKEKWMLQMDTLTKKKSESSQRKATLDKQTLEAYQQYEAQISALLCYEQDCKQEQKKKLKESQRTLNELKKQIIDKRIEINLLESTVNEKINNLSEYLKEINHANDCMRKREYYQELIKHTPNRKINDENVVQAKQQIVKELVEFDL